MGAVYAVPFRIPDSFMEWESLWEIEVLPMLEMVSDLYENTGIEEDADMDGRDTENLDAEIQCVYEAYIKKLLKGQPQGIKLFKKPDTQKQEQVIDLEVSVRYTDCVRVIRMNLKDFLFGLHQMIQRAVEFDNDHLFEFYIGDGILKRAYAPSFIN